MGVTDPKLGHGLGHSFGLAPAACIVPARA